MGKCQGPWVRAPLILLCAATLGQVHLEEAPSRFSQGSPTPHTLALTLILLETEGSAAAGTKVWQSSARQVDVHLLEPQ